MTLTKGKAIAKPIPSIINPAALSDDTLAKKSAAVVHEVMTWRTWSGEIPRLHANPCPTQMRAIDITVAVHNIQRCIRRNAGCNWRDFSIAASPMYDSTGFVMGFFMARSPARP